MVVVIAGMVALFAAPVPAADTIKVGAVLAVTGPASFLGAPEAKTLEMLVEETNAKGGINGKKIELIIKDTGADPQKAVSFAKQLIDEEKVFAIIGPSTSGETMQIKNIAEEGKTILLSCAAAEVIVNPVARYVFKVAPSDRFAVEMIFHQMKKMGIERIGLLSSNTGFGKAGKEQVEKLAPEHGIQILVSEVYDKSATDLTAEVTKLKAANVQAVLNCDQERPPDRPDRAGIPEPWLCQYPVRQGCRRCCRGCSVPGQPAHHRRCAREQTPPEVRGDGVQKGLRGQVQGGRKHLRRPWIRRPYDPRPGPQGERSGPREGPVGHRVHEGLHRDCGDVQFLVRRPQWS
jgi:hypothetical protein